MEKKRTGNYFRLEQFLDSCFDMLDNEHITKWLFMPSCGLKLKRLDGRAIKYSGIDFMGSPEVIFWSQNYIPKYIEDFCLKGIDMALENAKNLKINPNKCLDELKDLLHTRIEKIYDIMACTDARLRGDGFKIPPKKEVKLRVEELKLKTGQMIESHRLTGLELLWLWCKPFLDCLFRIFGK